MINSSTGKHARKDNQMKDTIIEIIISLAAFAISAPFIAHFWGGAL